jgi:hypothetical protein
MATNSRGHIGIVNGTGTAVGTASPFPKGNSILLVLIYLKILIIVLAYK